uniref:Uncharacterized protein n=1 Tax=Rhipicephalus pulchellus TaxID=72859 RepID=L7LXM7_RHIPC
MSFFFCFCLFLSFFFYFSFFFFPFIISLYFSSVFIYLCLYSFCFYPLLFFSFFLYLWFSFSLLASRPSELLHIVVDKSAHMFGSAAEDEEEDRESVCRFIMMVSSAWHIQNLNSCAAKHIVTWLRR